MDKVKKRDLSNIKQKLNKANSIECTKLALALMENHKIIDKELNKLSHQVTSNSLTEKTEGYEQIVEFEEQMRGSYPTFCKEVPGGGLQLVDKDGWTKKLEELKEKYPLGRKFFDENEIRINGILEEEVELNFKKLNINSIPDLSLDMINTISFMFSVNLVKLS